MKDKDKAQGQLVEELKHLRQRMAELEAADAERKQVEAALQVSEIKYRNLFNNAQAGLFRTRISDGKVLDCNEMFAQLTGFGSREECLSGGVSSAHYVNPSDRQRIVNELKEKGYVKNVEVETTRRDGSRFWVSYSAYIYPKSDCIEGVVVDITEYKKAEREIRESEEKYSTLVENATDGVTIIQDKIIQFANKRMSEMSGYTVEELTGMPTFDLVPPDFRPILAERFARRARGEELSDVFETKMLCKDGTVREMESSIKLIQYMGRPSVVSIIRDVTERKRMEEKLSREEQRFQALAEQSSDIIVIVNQEGAITYENPAIERVLGLKAEERIGASVFERIHPDDLKLVADAFNTLAGNTKAPAQRSEFRLRHMDGSWHMFEAIGTNLVKDDVVEAVIINLRDITERKKAEAEIIALSNAFRAALDPVLILDMEGNVRNTNEAARKLFETDERGISALEYTAPEDKEKVAAAIQNLITSGRATIDQFNIVTSSGRRVSLEASGSLMRDADGKPIGIVVVERELTERKQAEGRQKLAAEILGILNEPLALPDAINRILTAIKQETGFYAVGIRLKKDEDFPYFVQNGFSEDFLLTENTLVERGPDGGICRGKDGNVSLECTCGLVISGKTDPSNPLFTAGGSAWTNDSLPLLDIPIEQDPRLHPRNRCIHAGFQSVALMPIRSGNKIVGLLQLNDRRKGCFTQEMIRFFEGIAASIGVALMRKQTEDALRESEQKMRSFFEVSPDVIMNLDREGKILFINRATTRIIEETIGTRVYDYIPTEYQSLYAETVENVFRTGKPDRIETKGLGMGKRVSWYEARFVLLESGGEQQTLIVAATDITERKQAEVALRESEERFRKAFDNANTGMCLVGLTGKLIKVNARMCEIFGYSKEELERMTVNDITYPEDRDVSPEFMQKAVEGEVESSIFEKRYFSKKGVLVWGQVSSAIVRDADGNSLYFISQVQDVTERKRAEAALRESEERHRMIAELSQDIICTVDLNGITLFASPSVERVLGYRPDEVVGKSVLDFVPDQSKVSNLFAERISGNRIPRIEIEEIRKDGTQVYIEYNNAFIKEGEKITGVLAIGRDVTERKRTEAALRDSEIKYRELFEHTLLGMEVVDGQTGKVVLANHSMARIFGFKSPADMVGIDAIKGYVLPEDQEWVLQQLTKSMADPERQEVATIRAKAVDGRIIWVTGSNTAFEYEGKPAALISLIDSTAAKEAQDKLRESESFMNTLLNAIPAPVFYKDSDERYLGFNRAFETFFGETREHLVGKTAFDINLPELAEIYHVKDMELLVNGGEQQYESQVKNTRGVLRDVIFNKAVFTDSQGNIKGLIGAILDITERKRAEEALRESEEKYRGIFDESVAVVYLFDTKKRFIDTNQAGVDLLGYSREELLRMSISDVDADPVIVLPAHQELLFGGRLVNYEHKLRRKDGTVITVLNNSRPLTDANGKVVGMLSTLIDITERKRSEEALLRISKAVESSSDAIGLSDAQGHHFYHNKAFTELFEYTPEELEAVGGGPAAFENRNVARKIFDTIMSGGSWSGEVEMVSKSGRKFLVLERADAIKDESGKVIGLVGVHTDITETKLAEDKLRETRDYMENLIEHANVPMVVWTPDFRITRFNRAFERLTGMKAKSVIGQDLEILFPKQARERSMSYMRTAVRGAMWEAVEIPIVNMQGEIKTVLWNISTIYAEDRKTPIAIIAQGQDITERKQAEAALRESEEMSRSMLDNAAMGIYLLQNKKFLYVNPTFEKIIGYTSAELVGKEALNYVHPSDRGIVRINAVENLKGVSSLPYEFRALRKDGQQIWVMERVTSIKYKGKRAVIASFMETTEHRKAEVELELAYEELKTAHDRMLQSEKLRAMGEMASGIAHDFNNMLAVILGRTQLVIDDVRDDKVKKGIQIIEQAALDAAKTVKRLQDFARIRVEHPFESLDVNEVVEVVLKMVESRRVELEQTKGIAIKLEQELGKVGQVSGDATELREAMLNILFNAMDAMPTGGKLTVKTEQDEGWVQISIKDTGVGIPDKVKSRIFEPFFTTKASKGSGLGLSVTYGIIARHGGMIKFDSAVGKGTTFYIRLPLAPEAVKQEAKKRKAVAAKPANILTVDDEPEVLKALGLTLEYFGHWVKGFTSGAEAVKAFKDGNYDLVITDLGMPGMSGWDVARAIKKIKPDMPVLLITGWVVDLDEEQKKLVDGVIAKPFSRDSISLAISQVFPAKKKRTRKKKSE